MHDHAHRHHHHEHVGGKSAPRRALVVALAVTAVVLVAEVVGGLISGSVALLADAMHMLSDAAGLIISLIAVLVGQRAASATATFGHRRVEVLAALINAVAVLSISVWIVVEAVHRLRDPQPVETGTMMVIAVIGLIANATSAWVLSRHRQGSINVQGAYLHVLVDMFGSVAVLAAGAVIAVTGFTAADVVASLVIAALVLPRAWQLMVGSARVMLEQVPAGFSVETVERTLGEVEGATGTHDLHLWSLDGVSVLATVHVVAAPGVDRDQLLDRVQSALASLGVEHATVQIERPEHISHEKVC